MVSAKDTDFLPSAQFLPSERFAPTTMVQTIEDEAASSTGDDQNY
jgi:hypothetical protein